jgi:hypothetical protein
VSCLTREPEAVAAAPKPVRIGPGTPGDGTAPALAFAFENVAFTESGTPLSWSLMICQAFI